MIHELDKKDEIFALEFAKKAHEGQLDKGGKPYWLHVYRVGNVAGGLRLPIQDYSLLKNARC